jgi:hypothetical protein
VKAGLQRAGMEHHPGNRGRTAPEARYVLSIFPLHFSALIRGIVVRFAVRLFLGGMGKEEG